MIESFPTREGTMVYARDVTKIGVEEDNDYDVGEMAYSVFVITRDGKKFHLNDSSYRLTVKNELAGIHFIVELVE